MARGRVKGLDGLRAIACFAVMAHHLGTPLGYGGWLGVDVFFVLSGYLITGLLLREREATGGIHLRGFYRQRFARLYPALIVLVVAFLPFAGLLPESGRSYPLTAGLALTYTTDLWLGFTRETAGAFNHTWSLAVEEQFYLLWPLVVLGVRTRRRLILVTVGLALVSIVMMVLTHTTALDVPLGYYMPQTRAWELLAGCLLAITAPRVSEHSAALFGWVGVPALGAGILLADASGRSSSSVVTIEEVIGVGAALLLVVACQHDNAISRLLGRPVATWLGRRTYGMYLLHVPILAVLGRLVPGYGIVQPLTVVLTIVLAALSFDYLEQPLRLCLTAQPDLKCRGRHAAAVPRRAGAGRVLSPMSPSWPMR